MTRPTKVRKLAVVLSHPVQYYSPWFRWLNEHERLHLRVFYLWDAGVSPRMDDKFGRSIAWDVDLLSGYDSEFVPNVSRNPGSQEYQGLKNPELPERLRAWRPDAVLLFGYAYRTHMDLIMRRPPAPMIFRGDSHLLGNRRLPLPKRLLLRWIYSRFAAVTYVGQANRDYFRKFGVPESKLHFAPHCVDAERFRLTPAIEAEAGRLRKELGLEGRRVVLFAGKFVPAKGPLRLLAAFAALGRTDAALVFVGDGPVKPALEAAASSVPGLAIRFLPFANQSEMPARYAMADIVALPSLGLYETWGLAVNEAMHMGRPCLVSDRVGCQRDLIDDWETGWVFPALEQDQLVEALGYILKAPQKTIDLISQGAAERISGYTYKQASAGLMQALDAVVPG